MSDWNDTIIKQFRENDGKTDNFGSRLVLLHTVGAKTGEPRLNPMMYFTAPEGLFVIASKAGTPENPAWFHNLKAHPNVHVEQATPEGIKTFDAVAEVVEPGLRDKLFAAFSAEAPGFAGYQEKTERIIPVVRLHPVEGGAQ